MLKVAEGFRPYQHTRKTRLFKTKTAHLTATNALQQAEGSRRRRVIQREETPWIYTLEENKTGRCKTQATFLSIASKSLPSRCSGPNPAANALSWEDWGVDLQSPDERLLHHERKGTGGQDIFSSHVSLLELTRAGKVRRGERKLERRR